MVIVLPGDVIPDAAQSVKDIKQGPSVLLSPGTTPDQTENVSLVAIRPGALGHVVNTHKDRKRKSNETASTQGWWVECDAHRYVSSTDDLVIGQVTARGAESYTVSLFSAHAATLPVLAFEGATRRNRPNLEIGALVYARIVHAEPWTEPELSCVDAVTNKAEAMGELKYDPETCATMVWPVSLALAHALNRRQHTLLSKVAKHFAFEAAVGANGLVWTKTSFPQHTIALGLILRAADKARHHISSMDVDRETSPDQEARTLHTRLGLLGDLSADEIARLIPHE
ncbi:exosome non-catalytic core subunit rrp40 [Malassezia vespertilionis]|uniref:Ribosomal RNA-processing protein 40 n=1 Tax=Malassezia vespertilionis TaxID=2020962 RepID=A0A2N1JAJ8_9BASI|nr:exosome non-catalytic core subunit rrp40 [Malassezia vespertilionis]PKI83581.1 Rrp40p [Malassezia vespertilionis]WFD07230.1 exosome non-catalytic core subunit rrp40 [Malassezia vespertilionis]